jgi:hypothetical protein
MLSVAKRRSSGSKNIEFVATEFGRFAVGGGFDLVLAMFSVLGYAKDSDHAIRMLRSARQACRPKAVFVFDVWNGLNVRAQTLAPTHAHVTVDGRQVTRTGIPHHDPIQQKVVMSYTLRTSADDGAAVIASEEHAVRYFYPDELRTMLIVAGFDVGSVSEFPSPTVPPSSLSRSLLVAAVAR